MSLGRHRSIFLVDDEMSDHMDHERNITMTRIVTKRSLGKHGPTVSSVGPGAVGMSDLYGKGDR